MGSIDIKLENDEYIMGESVGGTVVNINRIRCSCQKYIKFLASGTERTKIMESTSTTTGSYSQSLYEEKNTFFVHEPL
jgi:hypothetical protein